MLSEQGGGSASFELPNRFDPAIARSFHAILYVDSFSERVRIYLPVPISFEACLSQRLQRTCYDRVFGNSRSGDTIYL